MGENQKSSKIAFPSWGETRNHRKSTFPHGGKQEIIENRLSQHWETQNSAEIGFPKLGKTEKQRKLAFPNLGRTKNAVGCVSQSSERRKAPES